MTSHSTLFWVEESDTNQAALDWVLPIGRLKPEIMTSQSAHQVSQSGAKRHHSPKVPCLPTYLMYLLIVLMGPSSPALPLSADNCHR